LQLRKIPSATQQLIIWLVISRKMEVRPLTVGKVNWAVTNRKLIRGHTLCESRNDIHFPRLRLMLKTGWHSQ
jgi:hypothetical protein